MCGWFDGGGYPTETRSVSLVVVEDEVTVMDDRGMLTDQVVVRIDRCRHST